MATKVAVLSPTPILTLTGTVTVALLLESVTLAVLTANADKVTVQVEVPGAFTVPGEQVKLLICAAAARLMVASWLRPFKVAVTIAVWLVITVPEVAVKAALPWPDVITTVAGTASDPLLLTKVMVDVLVAGLVKVTVQVLDALLVRVEGAQVNDMSCAEAFVVRVKVCARPFKVAVRTAV